MTAVSVRAAGAWRTVVLDGTRLQYVRVGGVWKPILDFWFRDHGVWVHETPYSPVLAGVSNLRMNPADVNNHSSIPVAWDANVPAGQLPADNYHVVLTDEGGSWLSDQSTTGTTFTFGSLTQDKRYRVYVAARRNGRPDQAWVGPLNWYLGKDAYSYVVNDPVYGWGSDFEWNPGSVYSSTSAANGDYGTWGGQKSVDNNFSTFWNSEIVNEPNGDATQGEGLQYQCALGGGYRISGCRIWPYFNQTMWIAFFAGGGWQGSLYPYSGKYSYWVVPYVNGYGPTSNMTEFRLDQYNVQTGDTNLFIKVLMQNPYYDGYNWRQAIVEFRFLLQQWIQTGTTPRTVNVAAVNSGYY